MNLKEIGETILSESKKDSFYWGIWVILAIFFVLQNGVFNINSIQKEEYWACPTEITSCQTFGIGSPSWDKWEYRGVVKSVSSKNDCMTMEIQRINGQKFTGFYCIGDEVRVGNLVVKLLEIKPSLDRPIHLQYYQVIDISWLIGLALLGIPFFILYRKYKTKESEKKRSEREAKKKLLAKKLKISEKDFKSMEEIMKEEIEEGG
jgi:hypothetical protein